MPDVEAMAAWLRDPANADRCDDFPTDAEREACLKYVKESASAAEGLQGVIWSLVNTKEFLLQH